jgi:hypothetical protein
MWYKTFISLGQFCHEGEDLLNWIIASDEPWVKSFESELKTVLGIASFAVTTETQVLTKSVTHEADFGV